MAGRVRWAECGVGGPRGGPLGGSRGKTSRGNEQPGRRVVYRAGAVEGGYRGMHRVDSRCQINRQGEGVRASRQ